jgi:hypothetical protein
MVTGISTTKTGFNARFVFGIIIGLFHLTGFIIRSKSQTIENLIREKILYTTTTACDVAVFENR